MIHKNLNNKKLINDKKARFSCQLFVQIKLCQKMRSTSHKNEGKDYVVLF